MDAGQVRRWIAGFEAVAVADREEWRRRGADPAWSIGLALSMIEAARQANGKYAAENPRRESEDQMVRAVWGRLRDRFRR